MSVDSPSGVVEMLSVGKLFAVAAILALIVGFISWPQPETGFYTITFRNRSYGFGSDYWAFSIGAIFAVLAASYRWLPSVFSLQLNGLVTHLHFWLSAISAFPFYWWCPDGKHSLVLGQPRCPANRVLSRSFSSSLSQRCCFCLRRYSLWAVVFGAFSTAEMCSQ
jgi:hypothetical protein